MACSFLRPAPPRNHLRAHSELPHWNRRPSHQPRNYRGSQEPYIRNQSQGPNIWASDVSCALITFRKLQGSRDLCSRNQRQRPIYRFSTISQMCCQTSYHVGNWCLTFLGRLGSTLEHVSQVTHTSAKGLRSLSPRQSMVLLATDLNCPVFPACRVPVSSLGVQRKSSAPKPSWPVEPGWHPRKLGNKYCLDTDCISYNWSFTSRCEDADSLWCPDGKALRHLGWGREGPGRDWGALSQEGQGEVAWTGRQKQEFQGRVGSHRSEVMRKQTWPLHFCL